MQLTIGQLVPLAIPAGWAVRINNWFYHEPLQPDSQINKLFVHRDCLLQLTRYGTDFLNHPHWARDFYLDLHWLGDLHSGQYELRFYEDGDEDTILAAFSSRSASDIQQKINAWLDGWSIEEFPPTYRP